MAKTGGNIPKQGRPVEYPWAKWFDGQVWTLIRGQDFKSALKSFRSHAHRTARQYGGYVSTQMLPKKESIKIYFYTKDGERR